MFEGLEKEHIEGAIEAMLFVTDEPTSPLDLAKMLECEVSDVTSALTSLQARLEERDAGIQLREVAGGWRLYTHPRYHELIEEYVLSWDTRKLSQAAMETLAVIAYTQPVTRAGVSSVRGVSSDSSINSLVEKGLVREVGVSEAQGNPVLYGTTRAFLEKFGLRNTGDLPDIAEFAPDEEMRTLIMQRLGATQEEIEATVADALASSIGVVEKIDFDALEFDFDDE